MARTPTVSQQSLTSSILPVSSAVQHEIIRKGIHLLIAFVPPLASLNMAIATILLASGILFYLFAEKARQDGVQIPLVSAVTVLALRDRDRGRFVLGPVTLGLGAMLALLLYPAPASAIAIYALAFGDGIASLAGALFGATRIPFTGGKTLEGSLSCFLAVFVVTALITGDTPAATLVALTATLLEMLPLRDFDNLVMPIGTGFTVMLLTSWGGMVT